MRDEVTRGMRIAELMTRPAAVCGKRDTMNVAARIMRDHDCGAVPVVDDDQRVIGMITDRDLSMTAYQRREPLTAMTVESTMSREVFLLGEADSVDDALALMQDHQVRQVPIVDADRRILGILSINDLSRMAVRPGHWMRSRRDRILETLAAICTPKVPT